MVDKTSRMWDSEEVKIRIKQLYRLGRDISYSGILAEHPHLLFAAVHYFRNWTLYVKLLIFAKLQERQSPIKAFKMRGLYGLLSKDV